MNITKGERYKGRAIKDLQKAAQLFQSQNNIAGYEKSITILQQLQR